MSSYTIIYNMLLQCVYILTIWGIILLFDKKKKASDDHYNKKIYIIFL